MYRPNTVTCIVRLHIMLANSEMAGINIVYFIVYTLARNCKCTVCFCASTEWIFYCSEKNANQALVQNQCFFYMHKCFPFPGYPWSPNGV